jgi:leader peptidase (prepilin peptidase)/N-methyltransferase
VIALSGTGAAQIVLQVFIVLIGATVGSFLNVVIFRLPRGESLVRPRSRCLSCGAALGVIDLVPVLSYLALRGRCRHCGRPYSPRYMFVELATGLAALAAWQIFGPSLEAVLGFAIVCCLIVVFFVDLDHYIIPDETVAIIAAAGVLLDLLHMVQRGGVIGVVFEERLSSGLSYRVVLPASLVGMAVGAGVFLAIAFGAERVFKRPAMGWGDVKLAGAMGAVLGPGYQFLTYFLLSVIIGAVVGLVVMLLGLRGRRDYVPFGPMMAVAGVVMILWSEIVTPVILSRFFVT